MISDVWTPRDVARW